MVAVTIRAEVLLGNYAKRADPHTNWGQMFSRWADNSSGSYLFFIMDQQTRL